jgi:hypothetical protein
MPRATQRVLFLAIAGPADATPAIHPIWMCIYKESPS